MKKIIYLSLMMVIPFLVSAEHGMDRMNGKWVSPHLGKVIKLKVRRNHLKVKQIHHSGWSIFDRIHNHVYEDCHGNTIHLQNNHELIYKNRYHGECIKFIKKGHLHDHPLCNRDCIIVYDHHHNYEAPYLTYRERYDRQYDCYEHRPRYKQKRRKKYRENSHSDDWRDRDNDYGYDDDYNQIDGRYFVRELDEEIQLKRTRNGLKAKRNSGDWVQYRMSKVKEGEFFDDRGNKYILRKDGSFKWKKKNGRVTLNLQKKK